MCVFSVDLYKPIEVTFTHLVAVQVFDDGDTTSAPGQVTPVG